MQNKYLERLFKVATVFLVLLSVLVVIYAIGQMKSNRLIGTAPGNTITVRGEGKVKSVPDVSIITLTIRETAKSAKEAQDIIAKKWQEAKPKIAEYVADKDMDTARYDSYPTYAYPRNGPATITGYEVSQSITLKVRNIEDAGKVLDVIATAGINEVSGPNFTIEDPQSLQDEARELAIKEAKEKAETLAKQLGVRLARIVSFSEGSSGGIYYGREVMMAMPQVASFDGGSMVKSPELPVGESDVISNVTITFEIN